MSASRRNSSADDRAAVAIPMLAVTVRRVSCAPASVNGSLSASRRRSAISSGPSASESSVGDHDELVPAEAPKRVGVAYDAIESLRDRSQELIAGAVAERLVDALEVVEIDEQRRHGVLWRRARTSICSVRSRISVRFGSPVNASWVAMNASSS